MTENLNSTLWVDAKEKIRKCHLSALQPQSADVAQWKDAFDALMDAVADERKSVADFAPELYELTAATGFDYDFADIFEEYFDHLEDNEAWQEVIVSCDRILDMFDWRLRAASQYKFRKGNALEHMGKLTEAEEFGKKWLDEDPEDYYAAASNVFLLITMGKIDEAKEITERYLRQDLLCDNTTDTFFMAAYRLYELTDDINAKQRVEKKIAEYNAISEMIDK